jgi:hypothetical protein
LQQPGLVDLLLDGDIEFDEIQLEQLPQEDLLNLIQVLRGHVLQLHALVAELSDQVKIIDAFARPKTSRRYFYVPGKDKVIQ